MPILHSTSRKKAWHRKTRNGCQTCKKRHIKCDEAKPYCRRCVSFRRTCEGYAENPKPWIFEPATKSACGCCGNDGLREPPSAKALGFERLLTLLPYKTKEENHALEFWIRLTNDQSVGFPSNALHQTFGVYVAQVAWNFEGVRSALISVASTALILEASLSSKSPKFQSSLSRQLILHGGFAHACVIREDSPSVSTVLTALLLAFTSALTGNWEEHKCHLHYCSKLSEDVQAKAQHIDDSLLTCVDALCQAVQLTPSASNVTPQFRLGYALSVISSANRWVFDLLTSLDDKELDGSVKPTIVYCFTRASWFLRRWKHELRNQIKQANIKNSPFAGAAANLATLRKCPEQFDFPLLAAQLNVALRTTLLYAASGNARMMRDAAIACHVPISVLKAT